MDTIFSKQDMEQLEEDMLGWGSILRESSHELYQIGETLWQGNGLADFLDERYDEEMEEMLSMLKTWEANCKAVHETLSEYHKHVGSSKAGKKEK